MLNKEDKENKNLGYAILSNTVPYTNNSNIMSSNS